MSDTYSNTADPGGGGETTVTPDIVVTDRQLFDSALENPEPQQQPEQRQQQPQQSAQQEQRSPQLEQRQEPQQPGEQPRNEKGQFAPRQQQPQPQQPPQAAAAQQGQQQDHRVPLRELLDERERRYRLQAEADQMRNAWAQLQQQALAYQQAQQPQTIYDNPEQYLHHNVMQPLRNEGHMAMLQIKDGLSREMANAQFGEQQVNAALQAMASVRYSPNGDHVFRQIMSSGHPYGELVKWFNYARAQQAIGPDPEAWLNKQREAWMNDPRVQAEVMRRQQQQLQQRQQRGGQPNVQLPPSLSSLPASSGRVDQGGDMSDASLFAFATR